MIGKLLGGRYKVIRFLGGGGGGETYVAVDTHRPRQPECVVKRLKPASEPAFLPIARRLFKREAITLERLGNHNQIPRLLAYFEEDEEFYLVQDLIEGHPLNVELPTGCSWSEAKVMHLLQDMLRILEFVHSYEVIHRDIKPANLIRRHEDSKIVLIDFGAVKEIRQNPHAQTQSHINPTTISIGTKGYMPAEQVRGKPRPSSDLYALGMIGIQALTGIDPVHLKEDQDGESIWQHYVQVSDELAAILNGMVRYHFRDRYQAATDVLNALDRLTNRDDLENGNLHNIGNKAKERTSEILSSEEIQETSLESFSETSPEVVTDALQQAPISLSTNSSQPRVTQVIEDALPHLEEKTNQPQAIPVQDLSPPARQTIVSSETSSSEANPTPRQTVVSPEVESIPPVRQTVVSPEVNSAHRQTEISPDPLPVLTSAVPQAAVPTEAQAPPQPIQEKPRRETEIARSPQLPVAGSSLSQNPRITEFSPDPTLSEEPSSPAASGAYRSRETAILFDPNQPPAPQPPPQRQKSIPKQFLWLGAGSAIVAVVAVLWFVVNPSNTPVKLRDGSSPSISTTLPSESPRQAVGSSSSATVSPTETPAETPKLKGNYSQLRKYLQASPPNWEAADRETFRVLLEVAGPKSKEQGRFDLDEWIDIDCEEFKEVDSLWRNASGGRLGFRSQLQIYNKDKIYDSFREQVGWLDGNQEKVAWEYKSEHSSVSYITGKRPHFNNPPQGHLPAQLEWEPIDGKPHIDIRFLKLSECKL